MWFYAVTDHTYSYCIVIHISPFLLAPIIIILFTQLLEVLPVWKIEMITVILSLIILDIFCSLECLMCVCVCVCFVTWLIQKQPSVQSSITPQILLWGWCKYKNCASTHSYTHTHLGPSPTAGCAISYLAQRLCATVGEAFAKSLRTVCNSTHSCAKIKSTYTHTHIWLCSIEQLTTPVMNGTPEGCRCFGGKNWPANCTVIGQTCSLITARLQLKVVQDSKHIIY